MPSFVTKSTRRPGKPLIEYGRGTENLYKRVGKIQTFTIMLVKKIRFVGSLILLLLNVMSQGQTLIGTRKAFDLTSNNCQTVTPSPDLDEYSSIRTCTGLNWTVGGYPTTELMENGEYLQFSKSLPMGASMAGLSLSTNNSFTNIMEFAFQLTQTGTIRIHRNGFPLLETGLTYNSSTIFQILMSGGLVHFFVNDQLIQSYATNQSSLRPKYCLYGYDSNISDFSIYQSNLCSTVHFEDYGLIDVDDFSWYSSGIFWDASCNFSTYPLWNISKLINSTGWDVLGRGSMSFNHQNKLVYSAAGKTLVGLSNGNSTNINQIDCALETNAGSLYIRRNGSPVSGLSLPSIHHSDILEIEKDFVLGRIRFYKNGTLFHTEVIPTGNLNTVEFSIYDSQSSIINMGWKACNICGGPPPRKAVSQENPSASVHPAGYLPFPNPFSTRITPGVEGLVQVVDLSGKVVLPSQKVLADEALDLSSLKTGMYLLEIREEGKDIRRHRIVKQ